ncbi:MAG: hypothetical protein ACYS18_04025 [Planctomycetota bacterium]|jgi:hypothetical protein
MAWNNVGEKKGDVKKGVAGKVVNLRSTSKAQANSAESTNEQLAREGSKDLSGGMEILEPDFLLSVVENTKDDDSNDITMRRLTFYELLRRNQLNTIDSNSLKVYAVNEHRFYDKTIQCEAIKVLAERTKQKGA